MESMEKNNEKCAVCGSDAQSGSGVSGLLFACFFKTCLAEACVRAAEQEVFGKLLERRYHKLWKLWEDSREDRESVMMLLPFKDDSVRIAVAGTIAIIEDSEKFDDFKDFEFEKDDDATTKEHVVLVLQNVLKNL